MKKGLIVNRLWLHETLHLSSLYEKNTSLIKVNRTSRKARLLLSKGRCKDIKHLYQLFHEDASNNVEITYR